MKKFTLLSTLRQFGKIKMALVWSFLLLACIAKAQDPPQYGTPFAGVPDIRDVNMYQSHIRPSSAAGNLAGVISRLDAVKDLGVNVYYLMPVYPHGTDARSTTSPYCIKDFKDVAPEYGTLADVRALVDGAHSRGMAVILDVAINGTSWDHPWITEHPDWYVQNGSGVIQQLSTYTDVAALNFNNNDMRAAIVDALRYWVFAANIDGFRFDFADNPPLEFWTNTINNLRSITTHKLIMFAEGDHQVNFQAGFDYNFGNDFYYGRLIDIKNGGSVLTNLNSTNAYEYLYATGDQQVVRFTANHDTEGSATAIGTFNNHNGVIANFMVAGYMKGVPMLTAGQEVDFNSTIPWPYLSVKINWAANPTAAADFAKVLKFRAGSDAIRRGTMTHYSNTNVCAFTKIYGSEKVVVMINMRNTASIFTIPPEFEGNYQNGFTGFNTTLTNGAIQSFAAYQYIVLTTANIPVTPLTGVTLPATASIISGQTQQLTPAFTPSDATNQTVTYTTSNPAIATVSATGLVTAIAVGTADITVTTQEGNFTAVSAVTVTPVPIVAVTGVTVSPTSASVVAGLTRQLTATVLPSTATNKVVSWTSGSPAVATVSATGLVTAVAVGTAGITVTTQDGNKTAVSAITVTPVVAVTGVTVSPAAPSVKLGLRQQLTAAFIPTNATNKTVTWASDNTAVASVSATGLVSTLALGTANITVTTQDGNKTAVSAITVIPPTTFTVHFYKPAAWGSTVRIYWWGALPTGALADGSWPGVVMSNEGNGWYMYTFTNLTSTNLIFNDGTNQTANLARTADGWYYNTTWYSSNPRIPTIIVTPYSGTYDGTVHTATGTAKGIAGVTLAGLNLSGTAHTNAGTYNTDTWTFTDVTGNYDNASGTVTNIITKANAAIVVTSYSTTYDGTAQTATGTAEGVLGETLAGLDLSGATHTDAGTYMGDSYTFTDVTGNYNDAGGTIDNAINRANATVSVTGGTFTYNGSMHAAGGFAYGIGGTADVLYPAPAFTYIGTGTTSYGPTSTAPIQAGTYEITALFDGNSNYNGNSNTADLTISNIPINASASAGTINCNGGTTTLTVEATGGDGALEYKLNDGAYQAGATFTVNAAGSPYTVTIKDEDGFTVTTTVNITEPAALFASSSAGVISCNGGTTNVTVNASGGTAPYTGAGLFTISAGVHNYTVTDNNGCISSTSVSVANGTGTAPGKPAKINGEVYNLCNAGNVTYSIPAVAGAVSYNWIMPSGFTLVQNNGTSAIVGYPVTFTTAALTVSASNTCGTGPSRALKVYAVTPNPSAKITGPANVAVNQANVVYKLPFLTGITYNWTVPAGATITAGAGTEKIKVTFGSTSGFVKVTLNNACGASPQGKVSVTVGAEISKTSSDNLATATAYMRIYPNPVTSAATVEFSAAKANSKYEMVVMDANGKSLFARSGITIAGTNMVQLEMGKYANGVYMIKLLNNGETKTLKLYKQK